MLNRQLQEIFLVRLENASLRAVTLQEQLDAADEGVELRLGRVGPSEAEDVAREGGQSLKDVEQSFDALRRAVVRASKQASDHSFAIIINACVRCGAYLSIGHADAGCVLQTVPSRLGLPWAYLRTYRTVSR